jgi:hypothetical protein
MENVQNYDSYIIIGKHFSKANRIIVILKDFVNY